MAKPNLEKILRKIGWDLADYQVGRFYKIPEEFQQTPCDFMGHTSGGRAILIEAKQVARTSLPVGGTSNGLKNHQWSALQEAHRAGCIALLCWARYDWVATIDVDQIIAYSAGRKSVPWDKIPDRYIHSLHDLNPFSILEPFLSIPINQPKRHDTTG